MLKAHIALLAYIAHCEIKAAHGPIPQDVPDSYFEVIYGRIKPEHEPPKPLPQLTVQQVLDWQDSIDPLYPSEASGAFQFMEDTLRGMTKGEARHWRDKLFGRNTQMALATVLLRRRGLDDFLDGAITVDKFCNSLAKEWASLPVVTSIKRRGKLVKVGRSYYAGDGLNVAHGDVETIKALVRELRQEHLQRPDMMQIAEPDETPAPKVGFLRALLQAITGKK